MEIYVVTNFHMDGSPPNKIYYVGTDVNKAMAVYMENELYRDIQTWVNGVLAFGTINYDRST